MGADLNNIVKCQKLTDDHVQFLIYQILRGLKVSVPVPPEWGQLTVRGGSSWWVLHPQRFRSVHRGASVTSLKYCRITFYYCSFTSASLELASVKLPEIFICSYGQSLQNDELWCPLVCRGCEFSISSVLFTCVVALVWQHSWVFLRRGKLEHPPGGTHRHIAAGSFCRQTGASELCGLGWGRAVFSREEMRRWLLGLLHKFCHLILQYIHSADIIHRVSIHSKIVFCSETISFKNEA